ncbi:DUF2147 domain-containing protein [Meridianimarinicoccus roseus]|uniref:DUF2147 domain-containing protein n=2 Tax=Meridianimarinicoccus roseus TaxID=2072018 RepID=A0A2V2LLZ5_9RHOB|nr:DUF2147 domain-containing protein [Meridianimarinicoccus roseus]
MAALALGLAAGVAQADPVEGVWQTQPGDDGAFGHVRIAPCGGAICGTLVRAYGGDGKPRETETLGRRIVWDMAAEGGGAYGGGKIWAPDRDKTYASKMMLDGDRLKVSGCVIGICRTQTWARVE